MKRTELAVAGGFVLIAAILVWQQITTHALIKESLRAQESVSAVPEAPIQQEQKPSDPLAEAALAAVDLSRLSNPAIRQSAARIMGQLGTTPAEDRLLQMVESDTDLEVRGEAMSALIKMKSHRMAPLLIKTIVEGDDLQRQQAAKTLAELAPRRDVAQVLPLVSQFRSDSGRNPQIRQYLIDYLRKTASPDAAEPLLELLKLESDDANRYQIALALRTCATRRHGKLIEQAIKVCPSNSQTLSSHDPLVPLLRSLAAIGDPRTIDTALPLMTAKNTFVQRAALEGIVAMQDPMAAPALVDAYDQLGSYNQGFVRQAVMGGYPGLSLSDVNGIELVSDDKMQLAMADRERRIKDFVDALEK